MTKIYTKRLDKNQIKTLTCKVSQIAIVHGLRI